MKVLIVSYFTKWVTHLGTELELAEQHLSNGDSVTFLTCDGSIGACMANPAGDKDKCRECILRRTDGIMELSGDVKMYPLGAPIITREALANSYLSNPPKIDDYKKLKYKGYDLGWGALSSAIKLHRDPLCDSKAAMQSAETYLATATRSYEGTRNFLRNRSDFERAYVFNGRFAETRGALRAIQSKKIQVFTHERGSSIHHYQLYLDSLPHNLELFRKNLQKSWANAKDAASRNETANQFYLARRNGNPLNWISFTEKQEAGNMPAEWDSEKRNIVIFNSSEDEFAAIGDMWTNPVYSSQAEAVRKITADTLGKKPDVHYYLRIHPNLSGVENSSLENLLAVQAPNLTTIGADDNISTYALLDACDCVMTFGSTVGVEATYWGKPSILAGMSYYCQLDIAYEAKSHNEVIGFLLDENLVPKSRHGALKYGYYLRTRGIPFKYWMPNDFSSGSFGNLFMDNEVYHTNNRPPLHVKLFLFLVGYCRSKRLLCLADIIAGSLSTAHRRLAKMLSLIRV